MSATHILKPGSTPKTIMAVRSSMSGRLQAWHRRLKRLQHENIWKPFCIKNDCRVSMSKWHVSRDTIHRLGAMTIGPFIQIGSPMQDVDDWKEALQRIWIGVAHHLWRSSTWHGSTEATLCKLLWGLNLWTAHYTFQNSSWPPLDRDFLRIPFDFEKCYEQLPTT